MLYIYMYHERVAFGSVYSAFDFWFEFKKRKTTHFTFKIRKMGNNSLTDCRCCVDESKIGNYELR